MLKSFVSLCLLSGVVNCGSDLCKNGGKIDSIAFVDNNNMWFFTSGGHYWYIKAEQFPPKVAGTPLPGGFKKGEAAFYKNTMKGCTNGKNNQQEIHLLEMVNGKNVILTYDTRTNKWINENAPTPVNQHKDLAQAKIDWSKPVDATFIYKMLNIVVIQSDRYSVVDISKVCFDPNSFGSGKQNQPTQDLNLKGVVDGTASYSDKNFYLFQEEVYYQIAVKTYTASTGKFNTVKSMQMDTNIEFFKFQENCKLPPTNAPQTTIQSGGGGPVGVPDTQPPQSESQPSEPPQSETSQSEPQQSEPPQSEESEAPPPENKPEAGAGNVPTVRDEKASEEEGGGSGWIIIVIIIIVVVLIAIGLIAFLVMRKGKGSDAEAAPNVSPVVSRRSDMGAPSKVKSSLGDSPSTMSVRSNAGLGDTKGSKVGSKVGDTSASKVGTTSSKAGTSASKAMPSSMGTSPSTMSIRSNAGLATSKIGSKTGSKK